jgi:NAD+ kinase
MDTLCNPLTGECKISYDFTPEEKPLLEDKIVSVLGCILSLLNKGREDVLSGRSSIMSSFRGAEVSAMEDKLPPLAIFRSEMKRCCESLHVALENYLTPDYDRSLDVWRKLQRLKNVCYDSGFPRLDDCPCHMLFTNWNAVYLSTSKEDLMSKNSEAAFWRGGQVTEEGLKWLLERGFKTIVDLRAEIIKDSLYEAEVADAIAAGKVELIKIPVEVRTAPSMEQVEKFASLVSDFSKKPIYLHSKEGVWRTSAMVSRWRQYMTRSASQITTQRDVGSRRGPSIIIRGGSLSGQENGSLPEALDKDHGSNGASSEVVSPKDENGQSINGAYNDHASVQGSIPLEMVDNGVGFSANISMEADPLKAQVPPYDFFSKAEMSRFFRTKKITPPTYSKYQLKGFEKLLVSRTTGVATVPKVDGIDPELGFVEAKRSYGLVRGKNASPKPQSSPADSAKHLNGSSNTSAGSGNGVVSSASGDDDMCTIEGNMCASATGVVRVQSRRKAEMFLVRTDGFSCAREQVTESSLAFTHPSTQQQMLMWKTTPKTVLLLKKLGKELMEEAKEVQCKNILN